nr:MAG TPA: hypothetical protein [Caudoviricetes sp.]
MNYETDRNSSKVFHPIKGRITEDRTALFRYQEAVDYLTSTFLITLLMFSTGKAVYKDFSIRELRALENKHC